ncbi:MAG: DUF2203 domain-containing protein [Candidatus Nitrosopelagicus sp.]|nr:DUF2203 domain-containing protein [Candidatus Nitrosopelagicus sp.]
MFTYFTIKSANEALPGVIEKFNNLKKQKNEIIKAEQELQIIMSSSDNFEKYITHKQKLNSAMTKFYQLIEELEATGVSLKGLDQGLLDFPSKRFDEDVWLCWKDGETEIKFWHDMNSGFNGRKPISISDESLV